MWKLHHLSASDFLNFRSNNGNVLAAADDFGHVRVFEYPARQAQEGLKSEENENDVNPGGETDQLIVKLSFA